MRPTRAHRRPLRRSALVLAALLTMGAAWLTHRHATGPADASAALVAEPIVPVPTWDRVELDRRTAEVLADWPTALESKTGVRPSVRSGLAIRADLFDPAHIEQLAGDPDPDLLAAVQAVHVLSVISVGGDLRCTIDGRLYRTGDALTADGQRLTVERVTPTHLELSAGTARFRVPMRP
ncbi:MAG: hypothetical protein AAF743_08895 [Planctomycetota bacterium]